MRVKMRVRGRAGALAAAVVVAAGAWVAVGGGGPAGAATLPGGTWGLGQPIPGPAVLLAIACTAPGDCVAVGASATGSGSTATDTPVVVTETAGTWGTATPVSGAAGLGSGTGQLTEVSCGAAGDCTAVGAYHGTDGRGHAFYVSETAGTWGAATAVSEAGQPAGTYSTVADVSCPAVGYCAIAGDYTTVTTTTSSTGTTTTSTTVNPFLLDEAGGTWDAPQPVPGLSSLPSAGSSATLKSVSCAAPGECSAAGGYIETSSGTEQPFVVSETAGTGGTAGTWGSAQQVPVTGTLAFITSVSCPDAADCTAAGIYRDSSARYQTFTVDERQGTWGTADLLANDAVLNSKQFPALACASAGDCVLATTATIVTGPNTWRVGAVADSETSSGGWGTVTPIAFPASVGGVAWSFGTKVSCVPGGDCTIAGYYDTGAGPTPFHMFAVTSTGGVLGTVQPLSPATASYPVVDGLSCPQDGYCTLIANPNPGGGGVPEVVTEATAATVTLTASAPAVTYGSEPAETFTATVASPAGGTPTGTVAVSGPAGYAGGSGGTLCTITLAGGTGSCSFTPSP